jgi:toxin YoeB
VKLVWSEKARKEYEDLLKTEPNLVRKINQLIEDIRRSLFQGLGKPEPLKGPLVGWWSRRITEGHRLVYRVRGKADEQVVEIAQCRYHY